MDLLDRFTALLDLDRVQYCVIGGQAVNAYVVTFASRPFRTACTSPSQGPTFASRSSSTRATRSSSTTLRPGTCWACRCVWRA